jgi:hypothetical protein
MTDDVEDKAEVEAEESTSQADESDAESKASEAVFRKALKKRIQHLAKLLQLQGEATADEEAGCECGSHFAMDTDAVINASSKVRVPMIALLYWKSGKVVEDYFRSSVVKNELTLDNLPEFDSDDADGEIHSDDSESTINAQKEPEKVEGEPQSDDANIIWERLVHLLRTPVDEAETTLSRTSEKLQKLEDRYVQHLKVLELLIDGDVTEEEIASKLGVNRDRIKDCKREIYQIFAKGLNLTYQKIREIIKGEITRSEISRRLKPLRD